MVLASSKRYTFTLDNEDFPPPLVQGCKRLLIDDAESVLIYRLVGLWILAGSNPRLPDSDSDASECEVNTTYVCSVPA